MFSVCQITAVITAVGDDGTLSPCPQWIKADVPLRKRWEPALAVLCLACLPACPVYYGTSGRPFGLLMDQVSRSHRVGSHTCDPRTWEAEAKVQTAQ